MSSSVNTLNPQVRVQGDYATSALDPAANRSALHLTLTDAVRRGLEFNLGRIGSDAAARQARAQRIAARSALLPQIGASVSENSAKVDLATQGFDASLFGGAGGLSFPKTVGPFHFYDLRGSLQQAVLDMTAVHNYRSVKDTSEAAEMGARQAREEVVLAVAGTYLQLMAIEAQIAQQRAEVEYAEASYKQAQSQADAGNKAQIEANRSLVELQTEQQRLRSQLGDLRKQKNSLARMIGLPAGQEIGIAETLQPQPDESVPVEEIVQRAFAQRQDLKAAEAQLRAAEDARKAAGAERLPTVTVNGYYGVEGINPNSGNGVYQASAGVTLPLFTGGRVRADAIEADAVVTERRAALTSQHGTVELEVRNAWIDLDVANDQVKTAESNRKLALSIVQQSQDRFSVGVADSVEVVNSQETLASADRDWVTSLFAQSLAKIALAHATGEAEKVLPDLFKGSR